MAYMQCPRCSFRIRPRAAFLAVEHCPRCLGVVGLLEPMVRLDERGESKGDGHLQLSTQRRGAIVRIRAHGEIDLASAPKLGTQLSPWLQTPGVERLLLHLRGVHFLDLSGVAELLRGHRAAALAGRRLILVSVSAPALRVLRLSGAEAQLTLIGAAPGARAGRASVPGGPARVESAGDGTARAP